MNEELIPSNSDCIVCVRVGKVPRENIYEMARKYWRLKGERASKATHVLAVIDGIVDSVFVNCKWRLTDNPEMEGRWEFTGEQVADSPYIGKSVKSYYGRTTNPVRYINM